MSNRSTASAVAAAAFLSALSQHAAAIDVTYRVIAASGQPVPGLPGVTFDAGPLNPSTSGAINEHGQFLVKAFISGSSECLISGNARTLDMGLQVVLRRGQMISGLPATISLFGFTREFVQTDDGRYLVGGSLTGTGVTGSNGRVWLVQPTVGGTAAVLARVDDPAPGLAGVQYGFFESLESLPGMNGAGIISYSTRLVGAGVTAANDSALWRAVVASPGGAFALAREGLQVAGQADGVTYGEFSAFIQPIVTADSDILVVVPILDPGAPGGMYQSLLRFPSGSSIPIVLARVGGSVSGVNITGLNAPGEVNSTGGLAFLAGPNGNAQALLVGSTRGDGPFRVAASLGAPAPGLSPLVLGAPGAFVLADDGRVSFNTLLAPGVASFQDTAVYSELDGGTTLIGREGVTGASPLPTGVAMQFFEPIGRGPRGDTLVSTSLTGAAVTTANDQALIVVGPDGTRQLLLREGSPFRMPDNTRAIRTLDLRTPSGCNALTPAREFLVSMSFTNNTRAYLLGTIDPCRADVNGDGTPTLQDLFDFLGAWFAHDAAADFNGIGGVTLQDLFDFLGAWFARC